MLSKQFIYTANGLQSAFFSGTLNGVCVSRWNLPWRNTLLYIHNLWASLPLTNNFLNRAVFGCNLLWRNNDPFDGWYLLQWCVCEGLLKALLHCANVAPMFVSLCRLQQPQCIFFRNHTQEEKVRCWKIVCKWMIAANGSLFSPAASVCSSFLWFGTSTLKVSFEPKNLPWRSYFFFPLPVRHSRTKDWKTCPTNEPKGFAPRYCATNFFAPLRSWGWASRKSPALQPLSQSTEQ